MASRIRLHLRAISVVMPLFAAGCASTSHVTAFQEATLAPAPRSLTLATDPGEPFPFGISAEQVARAATRAGFTVSDHARYRLALTAAIGAAVAGSYVPAEKPENAPNWLARPDRGWRARIAGGRLLRVNAVLIDLADNREVWRGTGTLRTSNPATAAPELVDEVLAKLPAG